jgi:hypothetical protein
VVLKYLAWYTHRVAISNARLLDFQDGMVRFRYKDYARGNRQRVMPLPGAQTICPILSATPSGRGRALARSAMPHALRRRRPTITSSRRGATNPGGTSVAVNINFFLPTRGHVANELPKTGLEPARGS